MTLPPAIPPETPAPFRDLYEEIADCPRCELARTRTRTVPGSGPATASIMFVGEGPGQREDEQGLPFVGAAGRLLDQLLVGAGLVRSEVYITNIVKCRPPGNRDPEVEEIAACRPYLDRQIEIIDPALIVTLGRFSMQRWFADAQISRIHGQAREVDGRTIVPMYHPAAALRRGDLRPVMEADFAQLSALAAAAGSRPQTAGDALAASEAAAPPQSTLL